MEPSFQSFQTQDKAAAARHIYRSAWVSRSNGPTWQCQCLLWFFAMGAVFETKLIFLCLFPEWVCGPPNDGPARSSNSRVRKPESGNLTLERHQTHLYPLFKNCLKHAKVFSGHHLCCLLWLWFCQRPQDCPSQARWLTYYRWSAKAHLPQGEDDPSLSWSGLKIWFPLSHNKSQEEEDSFRSMTTLHGAGLKGYWLLLRPQFFQSCPDSYHGRTEYQEGHQ